MRLPDQRPQGGRRASLFRIVPRAGRRETASALLIALVAAGLLGVTLGSYLLLIRAHRLSAVRSQAWNAALFMAESGVEEALAWLNRGAASTGPAANSWTSDLRTISPDLAYIAAITNEAGSFVIYSTGYATAAASSATIRRVLRVATTNAPLLTAAMAARNGLTLSESGTFSDSFDSADPYGNGQYQSGNFRTNGTLALLSGALDIASRDIYGDVLLGPQALFTNLDQLSRVHGKIQANLTTDFPTVAPPPTDGWFQLASGSYGAVTNNGTRYDYGFSAPGNYFTASPLTGSFYVGTNANLRLAVFADATINNFWIAGNGSVTLYMAGTNFTLNGNVVVENRNVTNFSYLGLATNTNAVFKFTSSLSSSFFGTVYAPEADLMIGANDDDQPYFVAGSFFAKSINQRGAMQLHYDENLARVGPKRGYLLSSWQELAPGP